MAGTVLGKSASTINDYLKRLQQVKIANGQLDANGNPVQVDWQDFTPAQLSYQKPVDNGVISATNDAIAARDQHLTNAAITEANNAKNKAILDQQNQLVAQAKANATALLTKKQIAQQAKAAGTPGLKPPPGMGASITGVKPGKSAGVNGAVSSPTPGRLVTINSHGHNVTVNSAVAGRFKGFLDALWNQGYHFQSVGGYANRNIASGPSAGTKRSAHSYGYAIDIDPSKNPVSPIRSSGKYVYALPPSVGALAAKYGLHWGGAWHSYKDFMHFSVPINGVE